VQQPRFVLSDIGGDHYWTGDDFVRDAFAPRVPAFSSLAEAERAADRLRGCGIFLRPAQPVSGAVLVLRAWRRWLQRGKPREEHQDV
jgi:hypothetical protein